MARGKHAAASTARKLREAEAQIEELKAQRAQEREEYHKREEELKAEIRRLQGCFTSEVNEAVEQRVQGVHERHAEEISSLKQDYEDRILRAFEHIEETGELRVPIEGWDRVDEILGVSLGKILGHTASATRAVRRMNARKSRAQEDVLRQAANE